MQDDRAGDDPRREDEDGSRPLAGGAPPNPGTGVESPAGAGPDVGDERLVEDMKDCKVALDIFEGPLDLLLYLIRREEVDVCDIPILKITDQYLRYLDLMRLLDLDVASEFLVMAATLLHIKSRMLLPPEERPVDEALEGEEDPRMALVRQLLEYKRFKEAAEFFSGRELEQQQVFPRYVDRSFLPEPTDSPLGEVSIFDLIDAFSEVLKRCTGTPREIAEDRYTVSDKIVSITAMLRERGALRFSELFGGARIRVEVVVTFLALLELIRLKQVQAHQPRPFEEIRICAA